ncbi:MAG: B12-binding domain-containing radical SAM protein [Proteobacteria bacterium]|nr:B12-binding domain-containing radical SAM protein [Pseudomonadota bacterium]MBU4296661.1 B12-binding domain-containing radical SAM protein [Pseudomonadota bacterium]MCG2748454.1 B12-binding domain-containing radical SAM protein [Desulfobulbaceae bacterium]
MRILLIAPSYARDRNAGYFPMGIAYISSYIRQYGHEVIPFNMGILDYDQRLATLEEILDHNEIELVGISVMTLGFLECESLIKMIRRLRPDLPIVVGGDITSGEPEAVLAELRPDYGVVGEGEIIFTNLLKALESGYDVSGVKGIWHWCEGELHYTGDGETVSDLDTLPRPDIDLFGIKEYLNIQREFLWRSLRSTYDRKNVLIVFASRSCPFHCTFCYHVGPYKQRSITSVVDEIEDMAHRYQIYSFDIYDDLFAVKKERIHEFCNQLQQRRLDIDWTIQMRVNPFVDQETLTLMKETGCRELFFGVESGSDTILKSMRKGITTKQIAKAMEMTRKAKIGCLGAFLLGDPAETEETLEESLKFQQDNEMYFSQWSPIVPYPGSQIWMHLCREKLHTPEAKINFIRKICNPNRYFWNDQVNLTRMSDEKYWEMYVFLRELNDINYRKQKAILLGGQQASPYYSKMQLACPSCMQEVEHTIVYPAECAHDGNLNLDAVIGVQGVNIVCMNCRREMHVAAKDIPHVRKVYNAFQHSVDALKMENREVVVIPALDRYKHVFFEDIDMDGLNVAAVLDSRTKAIGREFMGTEVSELNQENVKRYADCAFLVLPWVEYMKAVSLCEQQGVSSYLSWNRLFAPDYGLL